ncbi:hypothetical protein BGZ73_008892 [Actinomortierella ambigua]|nr:hypothetical protein BGZ73_008892 [Actinomortierella ambigua]
MVTTRNNIRVVRSQTLKPTAAIGLQHFHIEPEAPLNVQLQEGEVLLRNLYLGLDPYLRYQFEVTPGQTAKDIEGQPIIGFGISEVLESKSEHLAVGQIVSGYGHTWENYTVHKDPKSLTIIPAQFAHGTGGAVSLSAFLGTLGITGFTAHNMLKHVGHIKPGQTIFVSSAAGNVGQVVAQLAKLQGLRVIGSVGSDDKVDFLLNKIKIDYAFNYKKHDMAAELNKAAPEGLDVVVDGVGGETLDIAIDKLKSRGRIVTIGDLSAASNKGGEHYRLKNVHQLINKYATIQGYAVFAHTHEYPEFLAEAIPLVESGKLFVNETIVEGLENGPQAVVEFFQGKFAGKVLLRIAEVRK